MPILIVDDDADIRDSLQDFFEDAGYAVATARNGVEALSRLDDENLPCVVILDLIMPVVNGNQVYDVMQRDPRLSKVPVIVSTSDPSRAPRGVPILKKPIDLGRLMRAVREHCPAHN
jgi:CheY-like chemotaxis protein